MTKPKRYGPPMPLDADADCPSCGAIPEKGVLADALHTMAGSPMVEAALAALAVGFEGQAPWWRCHRCGWSGAGMGYMR